MTRQLLSRPFARVWRTGPLDGGGPLSLPQEGLPLGLFERYGALVPARFRKHARMLRNGLLDLRYGALLKGIQKTRFADLGAGDTVNTDYSAMPYLFGGRIEDRDVLVEVGCGKGRVMNWWLSCGYRNRMIGIELDGEIARRVQQRLRGYPNVTIIHGDAVEKLPVEGTLFYLANSFTYPVMERFKQKFATLFWGRNHTARIIYNYPASVQVFKEDSRFTVEEFRIEQVVECALEYDPFAVIRLKECQTEYDSC